MSNGLQLQLNNLVNTVNSCSPRLANALHFYVGQPHEKVAQISAEIVPYGKVAILYLKNDHKELSPIFSQALKQTENVITHVVLPQSFNDTIERYSQVFNLADDVRLIVATDKRLFNLAKYFASVRKIACVLMVNDLECYNALNYNINFANGNKPDFFVCDCDLHVVIDLQKISSNKQTIAQGYAFTVSHALALTDYRINCLFEDKAIVKKAYTLAGKAATSVFPLFSFNEEERAQKLVEYFFTLQVANLLTKDKIFNSFSCAQASIFADGKINGSTILKCALSTAKIYKIFLENKYDKLLIYPDYLQRAEFISSKTKLNHADATAKLLEQIAKIQNVPYPQSFSKVLIKDVESFVKCVNSICGIWTALGGYSSLAVTKIAPAIKHCGDIELNLMSLIRQSGISELI